MADTTERGNAQDKKKGKDDKKDDKKDFPVGGRHDLLLASFRTSTETG